MGIFGKEKEQIPPHPRKEPRIDLPLTTDNLKTVFGDSVDFSTREICLHGAPDKRVTLCYVVGMVRLERACDYLLRPLAQDEALVKCSLDEAYERMRCGGSMTWT